MALCICIITQVYKSTYRLHRESERKIHELLQVFRVFNGFLDIYSRFKRLCKLIKKNWVDPFGLSF